MWEGKEQALFKSHKLLWLPKAFLMFTETFRVSLKTVGLARQLCLSRYFDRGKEKKIRNRFSLGKGVFSPTVERKDFYKFCISRAR